MAPKASRPSHIIVFRRPSEKNLGMVAEILHMKEKKGAQVRASCAVLQAADKGKSQARVYHRLGVAVADISPEERTQFLQQENVAAVVPNEVRSIPPIPELSGETGLAAQPLAQGTDAVSAYLLGLRDAADLALRFLRPGEVQPGVPFPAVAAAPLTNHSWCLDLIGLHASYTTATGKGVKVAVLDTGIDLNHGDFSGVFQEGVNAVSFVSGESVQDGHGHGTHCAGTVGGPKTSIGGRRYGVAPDVELLVGKVLGNDGAGFDDDILDGMDWADDAGAQVISMSLGAPRSVGAPYADAYEVIAENLLESGTLVVAAAGNESNRPFFTAPVGNPAACPSILAVAAVDQHRQVYRYGCRQKDTIGEVDLSAPGVVVYSSWTGGGFRSISGTSMATPHVAGVAALYLEQDPKLTAQDLWQRLLNRATPLGDVRDFGRGLVQVP